MEHKLIGAGDLIDVSWLLYRANRKPLMKAALWMFAPTVVATAVSLMLRLLGVGEVFAIVVSALVAVPAYLVQFWATIIFALALDAALEKREFDVKKLGEDAVKKFLPVLAVSALTGAAVLLGLVFFIVPAVVFSVWFAFGFYEAAFHGIKGRDALKRSKELSRGKFWQVLWRLAAPTVFWSVVVWLATSTVFLLLGAATAPWKEIVASEPGSTYVAAFLDVAANLIQALSAPLLSAVGILLYRSLKASKTETTQ